MQRGSRAFGGVVVAGLLALACSDGEETVTPRSTSTPVSTTTTAATTSTGPATRGGSGVGDPYFPGLGNGGYDVARYDLEIEWTPDAASIDATATIEATATARLASFNLDLVGLEVERITVDGEEASFARAGRELTVTPDGVLDVGADVTVVVDYGGAPEPIRMGTDYFRVGWHTDGRDAFVVSEPAGAATWFPANDHPSDKARFRFAVTVPSDLSVVANGVRIDEPTTDRAAGTRTFVYEADDLMATYLASVVIGDLVFDTSTSPSGVPIRNAYPVRLADAARTDFARTGEMLAAFETWFGPYPFEVYGQVVVDEILGFALENQTLSLFGSDLVTGHGAVDAVVAHELAHQWFGNAVSPATWRDIWLNEGFATYAEWIWQQESGGPSIAESAAATHALAAAGGEAFDVPPGEPGPEELFQPTVYLRGGLALHAVSEAVGDDAFRDLLRRWAARNDDDVASTEDFLALAEEVSGQQLDEVLDRWVYGPELPPLP